MLLIPVSFYTVIQMDNYMNIYQPDYKITFVHQIVSLGSRINDTGPSGVGYFIPPGLVRFGQPISLTGVMRCIVGKAILRPIGRVSLTRENEAGGSWGQVVHILHVNI